MTGIARAKDVSFPIFSETTWALMLIALLTIFYLGVPLTLQTAAKRYSWIDKVGVVTLCYIAGIILGNIPGIDIPSEFSTPVMSAAVLLSIPLLLFSSDFAVWKRMGGRLALAFVLCIVSVAISVIAGTWLFRDAIQDAWIFGSMLMGVYTGGTPNLTAIGLSLGVSEEALIVVNGAEMLFGACWLLVILTVAKPVLARFMKSQTKRLSRVQFALDDNIYWKSVPAALGIALFIGAIAMGLSSLMFDTEAPGFFASAFLLVTTMGIIGSTVPVIRNVKGTFGFGNYLLLLFCVAIGSQADIATIFGVAPVVLGMVATVMFLTIFLHLLLCLIFRVDADTFLISSTAGIYGPPFIPPVARAIRNPYIIPVGLALGVLGLAIGNYCGLGISHLLHLL